MLKSIKSLMLGLLFAFWTTSSWGGLLSISEQEINAYLATRLSEKIPLADKVGIPALFQLDYKLQNLRTEIGQTEEKKVAISGVLTGVLTAKGKQFDAQVHLNLDTLPYYDPNQGALYLKDIRLLSYKVQPQKYENELQMLLPLLVQGLDGILTQMPVYRLNENKTKELLIKKFGKAIIVEKGALRLETSVF